MKKEKVHTGRLHQTFRSHTRSSATNHHAQNSHQHLITRIALYAGRTRDEALFMKMILSIQIKHTLLTTPKFRPNLRFYLLSTKIKQNTQMTALLTPKISGTLRLALIRLIIMDLYHHIYSLPQQRVLQARHLNICLQWTHSRIFFIAKICGIQVQKYLKLM